MVLIPGPQRRPSLVALVSALALGGLAALAAALPAAADAPAANGAARVGEVTLPLKDYLALTEAAERAEQARAAVRQHDEAPLTEVVAQRIAVEIDGLDSPARLVSELEVLVQGRPAAPLRLPLGGVPVAVEVLPLAAPARPPGGASAGTAPGARPGSPAAAGVPPAATVAAVDGGGGAAGTGLQLVAPGPGRFLVRARSRERLAAVAGESRLDLARIVGPVAVVEVSLPASLAWQCPGAVTVDERVEGGRRQLRLSLGRGQDPVLAVRRRVEGDEAAALLVQDVVTTTLQLRPEGLRRNDVVLYEVTRGALADLEVELPPGMEVERAGTDEGEVQPIVDGGRLVVHRQHRLQGTGYLVLTSRPAGAVGVMQLGLITPRPAPRARYLATAMTVPGAMTPRPAASWVRVDLGDLPPALAGALREADVTAAWRLQDGLAAGMPAAAGSAADGAGSALATAVEVTTAPQAAALETVVRRRLTTTLLTVDGTLVHQDRFELAQAGEALDLALPAGATLWSAAVDGEPVRPLVRGAGSDLAVPLGGGGARLVEVVEVLERAAPRGRSELGFDLAQVRAPVLEHRWRLLLPESARYRFRAGDLRPVPPPAHAAAAPGAPPAAGTHDDDSFGQQAAIPTARDPWQVLQSGAGSQVDRINVGGNLEGSASFVAESPLLDEKAVRTGNTISQGQLAAIPVDVLKDLRQGLVGGVRPLPVAIPETGKLLLLAGVLPPARVAVELEVRPGAR